MLSVVVDVVSVVVVVSGTVVVSSTVVVVSSTVVVDVSVVVVVGSVVVVVVVEVVFKGPVVSLQVSLQRLIDFTRQSPTHSFDLRILQVEWHVETGSSTQFCEH